MMRCKIIIILLMSIVPLVGFAPNYISHVAYIEAPVEALYNIKMKTLRAIIKQEKPHNKEQAIAAYYREGAVGILQIREKAIRDVNIKLGRKAYTLQDCNDSIKSVEIFFIYQGMYNPKFDPYIAAMVWNGGPTWYKGTPEQKARLQNYWKLISNKLK